MSTKPSLLAGRRGRFPYGEEVGDLALRRDSQNSVDSGHLAIRREFNSMDDRQRDAPTIVERGGLGIESRQAAPDIDEAGDDPGLGV
jgi:hypothetical protein